MYKTSKKFNEDIDKEVKKFIQMLVSAICPEMEILKEDIFNYWKK